jgi:hypothetical protein
MSENTREERKQALLKVTAEKLASTDNRIVLKKLSELKSTGNAVILPLILDLLKKNKSDIVAKEVLTFIGQLKDQKCVPVIVQYINQEKTGKYLADLISECWQSGLDFSQHLAIFAETFILGDYQVALESFTVIEEMLWKTTPDSIDNCRRNLLDRKDQIQSDKELLFKELIKVIDSGKTKNAEDYPDFFEK